MSRVIRGKGAKVVAGEVVDARAEAERLVAEARAEAERLVAEARAEAEAIRERARTEGRDEARAEAAVTLAEAEARRRAILEEAEGALVKLATEAARRIVREELELAPERVRAIAADLVDRVRRARDLRVRVCPGDAARLRDVLPAGAQLEEDPTLDAGDVVLITEAGELDARVEVQLEALRRAIEGS